MSIYDLVVDKLMLQVETDGRVISLSNEFNQIHENWKKVNFAEKILRESKISTSAVLRVEKSNEKSRQLRTAGNEYFSLKKKDYEQALKLYNESICFAENGSEDLGIGFANRSAIYFEWKLYELCLENIELARKSGYPERLTEKLSKREAACKKLLESQDEEDEEVLLVPKLTHPPHPKVPFIADCLEMRESPEQGRYIVTTRDLKVGQVVALEDDFCSLILPNVLYQRCSNCLQECSLSLLPCDGCTSAMFCSTECKEDARKSFHVYECPVIDYMFKMFNIIQLSAIRVAICALTSFDSVQQLRDFTNDPSSAKANAFTLQYKEPMPKSELYKPIHALETNQSKRSTADLFQRAVITSVIRSVFLKNSPLPSLLTNADEINLFSELVFRFLQTSSTNFHRLETLANTMNINNIDDVSYGSGAYSFCSLINHACSPNIVRLPLARRIAVFVLRPIKAGEELLDNYG